MIFPVQPGKDGLMHAGRLVFSQLLDFLPQYPFNVCVRRYAGNRKVSRFSCRDQFLCMAFSQLTYRESLRDTVTCLQAMSPRLYHVGLRGRVSRSTLADANEVRDWRTNIPALPQRSQRTQRKNRGKAGRTPARPRVRLSTSLFWIRCSLDRQD
jgi:hypothetical protein